MPEYYLLGGIGSAALSALFYTMYKNRLDVLQALESVVRLEIGHELVQALLDTKDKTLPYAIITGETQPSKAHEVIRSSYVPGVVGLMQKVKTVEHKSEWRKTTRMWHDAESILSSATASVPFRLCNSKGFVTVTEPFKANDLDLQVVYDKFEPVESNLGKSLVDWASGDKTKGFRTTEEMLCPGTTLTGIGELSLSDDGVKLSPPSNGLTYFLTQLGIDTLMQQMKSKKKTWKTLSLLFACGSGFLFLIALYKYYKKWQERAENEALFRTLREEGAIARDIPGEEENPGTICIICMDSPRNVVLLNCGHVCVCRECARQVSSCPVCRSDIARMVPIYQS